LRCSSSARRAAVAACAALALVAAVPAATAGHAIAVIVHPARAVALDRDEVARIFLRKRRFWDDGTPIIALNREPQSTVRAAFTRSILEPTVADLQRYWNEQYFHGVFPPPVLSSAAAVKRYVATDRNAIAYVETSDVDDTVRAVLTIGD
jgi:ABC-type phosphate transport system substrate-binding protein